MAELLMPCPSLTDTSPAVRCPRLQPKELSRLLRQFHLDRCLRYRQALLCPFAAHDIIDLSKRKHIVLAAVAPVVFQLLLDCSCSSHFKLGAGTGRGRVPEGCEMTLKDVGRAKT